MSKTQYIRHPWTHRSEFQKTKEFSKVSFEGCVASGAKAIAPDSDDELSDSERQAKRRRIEKLAEGYILGDHLFISSARPCPETLRRTIRWHKKSSNTPGFVLPEVHIPKESSQVWQDVEDDDEILTRLVRSSKSKGKAETTVRDHADSDHAHVEQAEVEAQASCKPQRRLRTAKIEVGPSEEALQQAAALRNRKPRPVATKTTSASEKAAHSAPPVSDMSDNIVVTPRETVLTSHSDKRDWLWRRKSIFSFGGGEAHDDLDGVPSPCIAPSSPFGRSPLGAEINTGTPQDHEHAACAGERPSQQVASYHTAPEDTEIVEWSAEALIDAQAWGPEGRQLSTVSTPGTLPRDITGPNPPKSTGGRRTRSGRQMAKTIEKDLEDQRASARIDTVPSIPQRRNDGTRSAPAAASQPMREQAKPAYLQAPSTQHGTTPLMYRRRATRSTAAQDPQPHTNTTPAPRPSTRRGSRRRITFPSSEDAPATVPQRGEQHHVTSHRPMLDLSFRPDDSFAPKLNMALVEEHINTMLPTEPDAKGKTTSVKKALRRELRNSGAEITRCDSEPPPTSPVEEPRQSPTNEALPVQQASRPFGTNVSKISNSERRQTWLGTQAMVARAEKELFTSPEKPRSAFTPINEHSSVLAHRPSTERTAASQEREPLKKLSQEPAPSTQAMLQNWGGFSTVKKPRSASTTKQTDEPTPIAVEKGKRVGNRVDPDAKRSSLAMSAASDKAKEKRGSSLRFSISSFESPDATRAPHEEPQHPQRQSDHPSCSTATSLATPAPSSSGAKRPQKSALTSSARQSTSDILFSRQLRLSDGSMFSQPMSMSTSTAGHDDFPSTSFQAAQEPEVATAGLLRDPSDLSQTVDDLTRDVLGAEGMFGQ